jgi:hypothetical protein
MSCAKALTYTSDAGIIALSLHASVIELMGACVLLAEDRDHAIGIPILLRSMKEATVDLSNLLGDTGYLQNIEAANLKQIIKLLDAAAADNPKLAGLINEERVQDHAAYRARYAELRAKGRRALGFEDRFRRAGELDEYNSRYAYLCLDAHNNIAALAERHIGEHPDGSPRVSIFQEPDPVVIARRLDMGLSMLMDSASMIHGAFKVRQPEIAALGQQLNAELAG